MPVGRVIGSLFSWYNNFIGVGIRAVTGAITGGIKGAVAYGRTTSIFRAVSKAEANGLVNTGQFSTTPEVYKAKMFGLRLSETRAFANHAFNNGIYNSIVSTRIPNSIFTQLTYTATDLTVGFSSGVVTAASSQLSMLNSVLKYLMFFGL